LDLASHFLLLRTIPGLSSFLLPDYSESRPLLLSIDALVWRSMYDWLKFETICQNWSYLGFPFSASLSICLVPLHCGRWSMTRFKASVRAHYCLCARLIQVWLWACFLLLTAVDGHLCPTYTSPQSSTPSTSCACPWHHAMNVDVSVHIFMALFARERLCSGVGSVTAFRSPDTCWIWGRTGPANVEATVNRITPKTLTNGNSDCSGHRALLCFSSAPGVSTYCYATQKEWVYVGICTLFRLDVLDNNDPDKHLCIHLFVNMSED
jgi:hypothetical protein